MIHVSKENMCKIAPIFDCWDETLLWSCLQGYMGNAWADQAQNPNSAQIITGDFCFFAGSPNVELVRNIPERYPSACILMVPQNDEWGALIEREYHGKAEKLMRYAMKKEQGIFSQQKLRSYIEKLPSEYQIRAIHEEMYSQVKTEQWSKDLCSQFSNFREFERLGIGFVVTRDEEIVSGASSYTVYDKGIEIEIDTKKEYRRKGLALACAAKLILECLGRGIYPSWDAANRESVGLAEKLGYHFDHEYVTYAVTDFSADHQR